MVGLAAGPTMLDKDDAFGPRGLIRPIPWRGENLWSLSTR